PLILIFHSSSVVELSAVNRSVVGSNPTCGAILFWPVGQAVKTPPFHGGNTGSSPVRVIFRSVTALLFFLSGQLAVRLKAHAWNACKRQPRFEGSNPSLSVIISL